jgi:hypothetical protein
LQISSSSKATSIENIKENYNINSNKNLKSYIKFSNKNKKSAIDQLKIENKNKFINKICKLEKPF